MLSRPTLTLAIGAVAVLGFSACKSVYSDTFSYRKNSFKAPVEKLPEMKAPDVPLVTDGAAIPNDAPAPDGGLMPGAPAPDAGAIPGLPGAVPAVPGL
jgi:hypothetical protein